MYIISLHMLCLMFGVVSNNHVHFEYFSLFVIYILLLGIFMFITHTYTLFIILYLIHYIILSSSYYTYSSFLLFIFR